MSLSSNAVPKGTAIPASVLGRVITLSGLRDGGGQGGGGPANCSQVGACGACNESGYECIQQQHEGRTISQCYGYTQRCVSDGRGGCYCRNERDGLPSACSNCPDCLDCVDSSDGLIILRQ